MKKVDVLLSSDRGKTENLLTEEGFASHAEGKGTSGNAEQAQGCNAVPSLSNGRAIPIWREW